MRTTKKVRFYIGQKVSVCYPGKRAKFGVISSVETGWYQREMVTYQDGSFGYVHTSYIIPEQ
jgi:hypothetical protein